MHGGTVTADSPGEGKGAVFTVTLPCTNHHRPPKEVDNLEEAKRSERANLAGLHVLVIDDLEEVREAFSEMLQAFGAHVETVSTTAAGVSAFDNLKPDIVVCDIAMPGEDGFTFIHKVRELENSRSGRTPAIAVTAYAGAENIRKALEAGFDAHLSKPVDATDLYGLIAKLAGRSKANYVATPIISASPNSSLQSAVDPVLSEHHIDGQPPARAASAPQRGEHS
jgi:CheY-like chemotaxis protein